MPSPTEKSLALLRAQGYTAEVVEKWLQGPKLRKDLYGFIDILGMRPCPRYGDQETARILAVQCTTLGAYQEHVKKLQDKAELVLRWIMSGGSFEMWCWGEGREGKMKWDRLKISEASYIWTGKGDPPYTPRLDWHEEEVLNPMRKVKP